MFFWSIVLILIGIYSSYIFGKSRIKKLVYSTNLKPKSQYNYHAQYVLSWCLLPALIVYFSWAIFEEQIIQNLILDSFEYIEGAAYDDGLLLAEIRNVANNIDFSDGKSEEIIKGFKEILQSSKNCKFNDCNHINNDGCNIITNLANGEISESRYNNFIKFRNK